MMNRVVLVGRMTRDPELRRTGNGNAVTSFTLALNRNFKSADGQEADFINCVVWNKVAENVEKYCHKGSLVGVDGKLQSRSYENNQGQKVYVVEVRADSVQFLDTKGSSSNQQTTQPTMNNQSNMQTVELEQEFDNSDNTLDIMEDDIQF